jgi:hypothetical protein
MSRVLDRSNRAPRVAVLAAGLLAALVLTIVAAPAGAATYSVYSCAGPSSEALPNSAWQTTVDNPAQIAAFQFGSGCPDLSVQANGAAVFADGDAAGWEFIAPPGTTIASYDLTRSASVTYPAASVQRPVLSAGVRETGGLGSTQYDCVAVSADCAVASGSVTNSGLVLTGLRVGVACVDAASGCKAGGFSGLTAALSGARVDVDDPQAPVVGAVGGSLPGSSAAAGPMTVDVTAADAGGGVRGLQLAIDGAPAQSADAGGACTVPYLLPRPCPTSFTHSFGVDTQTLAAGAHSATVTAIDAAGNASGAAGFGFTVGSGGQPPVVLQPVLRLDQRVITATSRRPVTVSGTLTTTSGAALAGAVLDASALDLGVYDAGTRSLGSVVTAADGRFSLRVRPDGAQRISFGLRPLPSWAPTVLASATVREKLTLGARTSAARVRPGGLLTISGALDGAAAAADGAPVEIDAKIAGSWRAVGVVEADARGRYAWRYRFTRVKQRTNFVFRAIVRRNSSWPWPNVQSPPVRMVVAP